jgi:hypothetical protein
MMTAKLVVGLYLGLLASFLAAERWLGMQMTALFVGFFLLGFFFGFVARNSKSSSARTPPNPAQTVPRRFGNEP